MAALRTSYELKSLTREDVRRSGPIDFAGNHTSSELLCRLGGGSYASCTLQLPAAPPYRPDAPRGGDATSQRGKRSSRAYGQGPATGRILSTKTPVTEI
jgi:hypothetical protein